MLTATANHLPELEKPSPYTLSCNVWVDLVIAKNENTKAKAAIKIKSLFNANLPSKKLKEYLLDSYAITI